MARNNTLDMLEKLEAIEDGIAALRFIANTSPEDIADNDEFTRAYNYVSDKVFDDMQTVRADLTVQLAEESTLTIEPATGTDD